MGTTPAASFGSMEEAKPAIVSGHDNPFQESITDGVSVETSQVPKAGMGAVWRGDFTIPKRRRIARYCGVKTSSSPADCTYVYEVSPRCFIDARDASKSNWTRYINDPVGSGKKANLVFTADGRLTTCDRIEPGDEFFVDYGDQYWG